MAIDSEVLVIGGGLAGITAAIAAAREGADVRLVSAEETTLRHASGLIDVLGYVPVAASDDTAAESEAATAGSEAAPAGPDDAATGSDAAATGDRTAAAPIADPFDAIADLPAGHPYSIVGVDAVREGLTLFDGIAGGAYRGGHTDANALVPTHGGTVKPTARYPASSAAGLASDPRETLFVGFERVSEFDAGVAADRLAAAGVPFEARAATIEFPVALRDDAKVTRYAHLLDENERVDAGGGGRSLRAALAAAVEPHLEGGAVERVGFPAVLGQDGPDAVRADLAAHLDADVFEVPMGPPSLPGQRLEDLLYDALADAGAAFEVGTPVVDVTADDGAVTEVFLDRTGRRIPLSADQFVLATGGLASDGVDSDREGVREPVFDCHVAHPENRYDWFADEAFGDHPFARFGLSVDDELRPLDADGAVEFANLRAAGAVLGNYDFAAEKSGSGVSLATGRVAGRGAAEAI